MVETTALAAAVRSLQEKGGQPRAGAVASFKDQAGQLRLTLHQLDAQSGASRRDVGSLQVSPAPSAPPPPLWSHSAPKGSSFPCRFFHWAPKIVKKISLLNSIIIKIIILFFS